MRDRGLSDRVTLREHSSSKKILNVEAGISVLTAALAGNVFQLQNERGLSHHGQLLTTYPERIPKTSAMIVSVGASGQFTRRVSSSGTGGRKVTGKIGASRGTSRSSGARSSKSSFLGAAAAARSGKSTNNSSGVSQAIFGAGSGSRSATSRPRRLGKMSSSSSSTSSTRQRQVLRPVPNPPTSNAEIIRRAAEAERHRRAMAAAVGGPPARGKSWGGSQAYLEQSAGERLGIKRKAYELGCSNIALEGLCAGSKRCRLEDITRGKVAVVDFWVTRGRGATSIATMDA